MTLGLVCDACDALSPVSAGTCQLCGEPLGILGARASGHHRPIDPAVPPPGAPATVSPLVPAAAPRAVASPSGGAAAAAAAHAPATAPTIVQCSNCGTPMPVGHRFCGACGNVIETPPAGSGTHPYGASQAAGRARLVVIRREGFDGTAFHLSGPVHLAGRREGDLLFPGDRLLSPRHASFFYRGADLFVRDEGSRNGVFLRLRHPFDLDEGQQFLVGEQLLAVVSVSPEPNLPAADGTLYYASPRRPARIKVVQILAGGDVGFVHRARNEMVSIGREGNDINFPDDPFISGHHAELTALLDGRFRLVDKGSKNGTFVRVHDEARLAHGDYVFLGGQLLRVEVT
jgi:pSer/pThr/pTyr-binding forkhead associated (FHA) protein